jgi:hypothetical protein
MSSRQPLHRSTAQLYRELERQNQIQQVDSFMKKINRERADYHDKQSR